MLQFTTDKPATAITPLHFTGTWQPLSIGQAVGHQHVFSPTDVVYQLSPPRPSFYEEFITHQLLDQIKNLPDNWDGYGASPLHDETVRNAHCALSALLLTVPVPEMVPNPNGTISFEWHSLLGHANLEIGRKRFSFFLKLAMGPTIPLDGNATAIPSPLGPVIAALLYPVSVAQITHTAFFAK